MNPGTSAFDAKRASIICVATNRVLCALVERFNAYSIERSEIDAATTQRVLNAFECAHALNDMSLREFDFAA